MSRGHKHMKLFSLHMNVQPPLAPTNYKKAVNRLHKAYVAEASQSMKRASESIKAASSAVSINGTWQNWGHASLNGESDIDFNIKLKVFGLSSEIKGVFSMKCLVYERSNISWVHTVQSLQNYVCLINHQISASSMETESAKEIFARSKEPFELK